MSVNEPSAPHGETTPTPPFGFPHAPAVRSIVWADVIAALREGVADFKRAPLYGLFFAGVYVIGGWLLYALVAVWDTPWAIIPLAVAFPLIGPFVAVGLYEVSRRLSAGAPLRVGEILTVVYRQSGRELVWMAFVMLFVFWIWAYQVRLLLALLLSDARVSTLESLASTVFLQPQGWIFLAVGAVIGGCIAFLLFCITVIATPLLLDREIDIVSAMVVSVTAVRRNLRPMLGWAALVALGLALALAPAFLGLLVALPIFGHATWRLYERLVVRRGEPA